MDLDWYFHPLLWGAFGGLSVQLLNLIEGDGSNSLRLVSGFGSFVFFTLPFFIHPFLGGMLAWAHELSSTDNSLTPLLALNVGIAAPLIIRQAATQSQSDSEQDTLASLPDDA
ncbi:MAG: hypothetical protein ACPGSB_00815 [Opitutales bacterium]